MNPNIAAIGNLQVDNVVSAGGKVGVNSAGGNGGYAAAGVRLWTGRCLLIAQAPENFPAEWLEQFERSGVDIRGVTVLAGFNPKSSEWFFYRTDGSRRDFVFAEPSDLEQLGIELPAGVDIRLELDGARTSELEAGLESVSAGRIEPTPSIDPSTRAQEVAALAVGVKAIHLSPASLELHRQLTRELAARDRVISLDPGHYVKNLNRTQLGEILQGVSIFAPSEREVQEFRGPCDLREAAQDFAALGPGIIVIKMGDCGALVYQRDKNTFDEVPAFPARTLDPTGCGDSFCGGLLAGFLETGDAVQAAQYGTIAASFTVEGFGATYSLSCTRQDAEQRLSKLRERMTPYS